MITRLNCVSFHDVLMYNKISIIIKCFIVCLVKEEKEIKSINIGMLNRNGRRKTDL